MTDFEGTYLGGAPGRAAISAATQALRAFLASREYQSVVPRPTNSHMAVLDFTQGSVRARGALLERPQQSFLVAHGGGTDGVSIASTDQPIPGLSNRPGSHLSSAGLFIAKSIVPSAFGTRLRMFGVCRGLNDNADARLIGMHPYNDRMFAPNTRGQRASIATSHGCPAISSGVARQIMPYLDGGFIYIYHPDHPPRGWTDRPAQSSQHARVR